MGGKPATAGHIKKLGPKTAVNEPKTHRQENLQAKHNDAKSGHFCQFWRKIRFKREMQGPTPLSPALGRNMTTARMTAQIIRAVFLPFSALFPASPTVSDK